MLCDLIETSEEIDKKLDKFYTLHLNAPINLTAIKDKEEFYVKHYLDSIYYFEKCLDKKPSGALCDIGSGGGFPGIVLAIFYPQLKVTLVESITKKCKFLENVVKELELRNVEIVNMRAEGVKGRYFDIITARGVASVGDVLKNTRQLAKKGSYWLLYKGEKTESELQEASDLLRNMGAKVETIRIEQPWTRTYCIINR